MVTQAITQTNAHRGGGFWVALKHWCGLIVSRRDSAWYQRMEHIWAIQAYDRILEGNPEHSLSYNNRGCSYFELGDLWRALQDFTEAIRSNDRNSRAYNNRAAVYISLGMNAETVRDLEHASQLGLDPFDLNEKIDLTALTFRSRRSSARGKLEIDASQPTQDSPPPCETPS